MSKSRELAQKLIPSASAAFSRVLRERRAQFWGSEELNLRVRTYPKAKDERVSFVKPDVNVVELYSRALGRKIPLQLTSQMLRDVEAKGGLDDYLMNTPDRLLRSDVASQLKWRISNIVQRNSMAAMSVAAMRSADAAEAAAEAAASMPAMTAGVN